MPKVYLTKIPPWKLKDECKWFVLLDETEEGKGVHLFHMISPSKLGPWNDWRANRELFDEYLLAHWDIEPENWKEYQGPLEFRT